MPRRHDGPRPYGRLLHSGTAGIGFGNSDPSRWNEEAAAEEKEETKRKNVRQQKEDEEKRTRTSEDAFRSFRQRVEVPAKCLELLEKSRWPDGVTCPKCGGRKCIREKTSRWRCGECESAFAVTIGTNNSIHLSELPCWFLAALLILEYGDKLSDKQFAHRIKMGWDSERAADIRLRVGELLNRKLEAKTGEPLRDILERISWALLPR
jgi:transposase-like protein